MNFGETREVKTETSGKFIVRSIGAIDFSKIYPVDIYQTSKKQNDWQENYDPRRYFKKITHVSLSGKPEDEVLKIFKNFEFFVPFQVDNQNWWNNNKEMFEEKLKHLDQSNRSILLAKPMPLSGAIDENQYLSWYVVSREFFSDDWVVKNAQFIEYMDALVDKAYKSMIESSEIGLKTGIQRAKKLNLDFNYSNGVVAENLAKTGNLELLKYVAGNGAKITSELFFLTDNVQIKDFVTETVTKMDKKINKSSRLK